MSQRTLRSQSEPEGAPGKPAEGTDATSRRERDPLAPYSQVFPTFSVHPVRFPEGPVE